MDDSGIIKENLISLTGSIYTFNPGIEPSKIHNMYHGLNNSATGYSKYDISVMSNIACEKYIVENKLIRKEGDARSVEIRFEFPEFYLIVNRQSYIYPNHHVGKTVLILPKCRYVNGFTSHSFYETLVNYYHKYLNEEYTNYNVYPLKMIQDKVFDFKNQKYYPVIIFKYKGTNYHDYLYPKFYKVVRNNKYFLNDTKFKDDVHNMEFKIGFEFYADVKTINLEISYNLGKIISVKVEPAIQIQSIHFNHYYYNGTDFSLGRYNFSSTVEFESEILRQIYQYYCAKIDFDCEYMLNRMKHRNDHKEIIKKIIYMKPAVKLFVFATMIPRNGLEYPLLNTLVIRRILEDFY